MQYNTIQYNTNTIQYNFIVPMGRNTQSLRSTLAGAQASPTIHYTTIQYNATQYNIIQIQYNTIQIQYNFIVPMGRNTQSLRSTLAGAQASPTIHYTTIQYNATQYNIIPIQYNTTLLFPWGETHRH